ncbi:unnamed protein product [Ceutorhynchus assimilis]|uniref:BACK domain-containing protein n=1 Tax=Ceutorhynchus assimilis TaxID=467358 RepID=A0A9P0DNK3_9CUCU|nr:unnamed protein product [Ceutorhynchus assimilis]
MVQVTNRPEDEQQPMLPGNSCQDLPNDLKSTQTISITDEAYRVVASAMMADPLNPTNDVIALSLLETALMNRNVPLAKHYISSLQRQIKQDNALKILVTISRWLYMPEADQQFNFEPSAPPLVDNADERNDNWMKEPLQRLRDDILLEIDKQGDYFLKQKEIEDLHYQDLLGITTRDTLQLSNEMIAYCAIMRWAVKECQRKALSFEDVNIKAVLKELIYAPRYGLMSKREFRTRTVESHRGPDRIGLPGEMNERILAYITQRDKKKKDKNGEELPYKMSRERTKNKPNKSQNSQPMKEKVIINCLTCFSAVFD